MQRNFIMLNQLVKPPHATGFFSFVQLNELHSYEETTKVSNCLKTRFYSIIFQKVNKALSN